MTIKSKLLGNALFTSSLMLVILATLIWSLGNLRSGLQSIVENSRVGTEMSQATETTLAGVSGRLSNAAIELSDVASDISMTTQSIKINERKIANLSQTLSDFSVAINSVVESLPDNEIRWDLEDLSGDMMDIQDSLNKEALVGLSDSALRMTKFSERVNASADISTNLVSELQSGTDNSRLSNTAAKEIAQLSASFGESFAGVQKLLTALIILAVAFSVVMGILIIRALIPPLERAVHFAGSIANGDLSVAIDLNSNDEIGQLGSAMKTMVKELAANRNSLEANSQQQHNLIAQVTSSSVEIALGAGMVANTSSVLSRSSIDQAAALEEVNSSIDLITDQIKKTAKNAIHANDLADTTQQSALKGTTQTQNLNKAMGDIHDSSEAISKIIKTIDDIAFQTNLLALNAAVEAARAGKHGKGFAVVAEEVRSLAGRSAKAARETAILIDESVNRADRGLDSVEQTSAVLDEIASSVIESATLVAEISTTANQQASGIDEIRLALNQMSAVVQQTAASAEESASASEELSGQSHQLKSLLEINSTEFVSDESDSLAINSSSDSSSYSDELELSLT